MSFHRVLHPSCTKGLLSSSDICCTCFSRGSNFIALCQLTLDFSIHALLCPPNKGILSKQMSNLEGHFTTLIFGRLTSSSITGSCPGRQLCDYVSIQVWAWKASVLLRKWSQRSKIFGPGDEILGKTFPPLKTPMPFYYFLVCLIWNDLFSTQQAVCILQDPVPISFPLQCLLWLHFWQS